jgi:hypothetical protein
VFVSAANAEVAVEGRVEPAAGGAGWSATIVLSGPGGEVLGERTIGTEQADCGALAGPLALVIAVMIDPDAAMRAERAEEEVPEEPEEQPAVEPEPEPEPEVRARVVVRTERVVVPVERDGPSWRVEIDVGAGAVFGVVADAAPVVVGSVYVVPPRFIGLELGLGLAYMRSSPAGSGTTDFGYGFASLAVCPLATGDSLSVAACGGLHLGAVRVSSPDDGGPPTDERVTVDVAVRARLAWRVQPWLSVLLRPAVLIPIRREPYTWAPSAGEQRELYAPWAVAPMIDLGAGVRF